MAEQSASIYLGSECNLLTTPSGKVLQEHVRTTGTQSFGNLARFGIGRIVSKLIILQ